VERYAFQPEEIKPVALVDENIQVYDEGKWKYYRVTFIEPIQPFQRDFGSITAGGSTGDKDIEELRVGKGWCAIVRVVLVDDLKVTVKQPKAITRYVVSEKVTSYLTALNEVLGLRHLTELCVLEERVPIFDVTNPTKYDVPASRVVFYGLKMEMEELPAKPEKYASLMATGK